METKGIDEWVEEDLKGDTTNDKLLTQIEK
jgi:hypothetical protein